MHKHIWASSEADEEPKVPTDPTEEAVADEEDDDDEFEDDDDDEDEDEEDGSVVE